MKKFALAAVLSASVGLSACATNPYGYGYNDPYYGNGYNQNGVGRAATGAAVGAGVGAVAGAVIPGVSTVEGAIAGGIAGAVLGSVIKGRQYYRDTRGYCYYVDNNGNPIYDYNTRC